VDLTKLGWNAHFKKHLAPFVEQDMLPARVAREDRRVYLVYGEMGEFAAEVSGKFAHDAQSIADFPAVGDWVAVRLLPEEGRAIIHAVLPRRSGFSRKAAGPQTQEQIVAANVDTVFLVSGLDGECNLRRIERYLTLAADSGAKPVVVLNKADLCESVSEHVRKVKRIAPDTPIHAVSAKELLGLDALREHLGCGETVAFIGSSGVGKSALINALLGAERQEVRAVRESDRRGRHTTTRRELIPLPDGALLIDSPGMRELQLWTDEESLGRTFDDIEELARQCRFRDCRHRGEPGCAVQAAVKAGELDAGRVRNYLRLTRELSHLAVRQDDLLKRVVKQRKKQVARRIRRRNTERGAW
jgi:ribosome biogenesis GTPase